MRLQSAAATSDLEALRSHLFEAMHHDIDTASALLEATQEIWGQGQAPLLCGLYLDICKEPVTSEIKACALTNLAEVMSQSLSNGEIIAIPAVASDSLSGIFRQMQSDKINPTLANAILSASGPLMASIAFQYYRESNLWQLDHRLRAWGKMIADALHDSNTFDMRMAAVQALLAFANVIRLIKIQDAATHQSSSSVPSDDFMSFGSDASFLPFFLALYATLIDDDEEIREVGAIATAQVMCSTSNASPQPPVAVDAADALLGWLRTGFGHTNEFEAYVACRLIGDPLITIDIGVQDLKSWGSPDAQFSEALKVDESLFAVEEQNLFIDEVRETERWAVVFRDLPWDFDELENGKRVLIMDSSLSELRKWTVEALRVLAAEIEARRDDGPLGWVSNPAAFALCHRVLTCGNIVSGLLAQQDDTFAPLLDRIKEIGGQTRFHGLLLSTVNDVKDAQREE